jgi:RluA family pseudouridine synthase
MNDAPLTRHPVLFRDDRLIFVHKPAGVNSHPNPGERPGGAAFEGRYDLRERRFDAPGRPVWLIHRLDRDVSGVLLGALDAAAARACRELFEAEKVEKEYVALVAGTPPSSGRWTDRLEKRREKGAVRSAVRRAGPSNAELRFRVRRRFPEWGLSLLDIQLVTGKTHQIRVQAAHRGFPVAGDGVYGDFGLNRRLRQAARLKHMFLHARMLGIRHPGTHRFVRVEAPLPQELETCLSSIA